MEGRYCESTRCDRKGIVYLARGRNGRAIAGPDQTRSDLICCGRKGQKGDLLSVNPSRKRGQHAPCKGNEGMGWTRDTESRSDPLGTRGQSGIQRRWGSWRPSDPSNCASCRPAVGGLDQRQNGRVERVERKEKRRKKKERKNPPGRRQHAGTEGMESGENGEKGRQRDSRPAMLSQQRDLPRPSSQGALAEIPCRGQGRVLAW